MTTTPRTVSDAIAEVVITHRVLDSPYLDVLDSIRTMLQTDSASSDVETHILYVYEHAIKMLAHNADYTDARSTSIINALETINESLWDLNTVSRDPWAERSDHHV